MAAMRPAVSRSSLFNRFESGGWPRERNWRYLPYGHLLLDGKLLLEGRSDTGIDRKVILNQCRIGMLIIHQ
jgi:hypothetical protein